MQSGDLTIVGLDPGGTTGVAYFRCAVLWNPLNEVFEYVNPNFNCMQIGPGDHHAKLYSLLGTWQTQNYIVVCESFEYRRNPKDQQRDNIVLDSKEYIGVAKLFYQRRMKDLPHNDLVFQTAAVGKGFWTDEKLKKVGHYQVGMKHANDAMRHLLHYLSFKLNDPTGLFLKLKE